MTEANMNPTNNLSAEHPDLTPTVLSRDEYQMRHPQVPPHMLPSATSPMRAVFVRALQGEDWALYPGGYLLVYLWRGGRRDMGKDASIYVTDYRNWQASVDLESWGNAQRTWQWLQKKLLTGSRLKMFGIERE